MILYRGKVYNFNLIQNEVIKINTYVVKPLSSKKKISFLFWHFYFNIGGSYSLKNKTKS